jgi:antitoxin component of RelBE/YafQ-DinJ toxin-antitoxin module
MQKKYFYIPIMSPKATKLVQVKVDPAFKKDLDEVAKFKGITVASFVKLTLKEAARKGKREIYTENGLTIEQEQEILRREKEAIKDHLAGKSKTLTIEQLMEELNE